MVCETVKDCGTFMFKGQAIFFCGGYVKDLLYCAHALDTTAVIILLIPLQMISFIAHCKSIAVDTALLNTVILQCMSVIHYTKTACKVKTCKTKINFPFNFCVVNCNCVHLSKMSSQLYTLQLNTT
jgi:hypothetical protein